jgi:catechol 2,3-dioxygenase-like lactoylglutathione lyase family enzyme
MSIHHVTAIAGDPVKNLSFYTRDQTLIVSMILSATKGAII